METDRKLLILDLDETLIYSTEEHLEREADFKVEPYHVYRRPHVDTFLAVCAELFELAAWSSSSTSYTHAIVEAIFPFGTPLAFVWGRERCTLAIDASGERYWRKTLRKVTRRGYRPSSIIVVDDSPEKWIQSYGNLVLVKPFYGDPQDDELRHLLDYLDRLRMVENVRSVEKRSWRRSAR